MPKDSVTTATPTIFRANDIAALSAFALGAVVAGAFDERLARGLFAGGRLFHNQGLADAGLHSTEAVLASGALTVVLKGIVGRARPYAVGDSNARAFRVGHGVGAYASLPSGHTTVAFAAAAALSEELTERRPGAARFVAPMLYSGAALVGLSRMYNDKHWASDVVAAAAIGTLTGRTLVRYTHTRPASRLNRWLRSATIAPGRAEMRLSFNLSFQ